MSDDVEKVKQGFRLAIAQLTVMGVDLQCPECAHFNPGGPGDCKAGEDPGKRMTLVTDDDECPEFLSDAEADEDEPRE